MWFPRKTKASRGFTLLEMVVSFVILGFIGLSLGSGLVYSIQLFRTSQAIDLVLPQVDAAIAAIRYYAKHSGDATTGDLKNNIKLCTAAEGYQGLCIRENSLLLLGHVTEYSVTPVETGNGVALTRIRFSLDLDGNPRTYQFDVCQTEEDPS